MRTRRFLVALGGALFVLTGCDHEAGPTPGPNPGTPGPDALPIKLDALSTDECFTAPSTQAPKGCEKYVTELGGTSGQIRQRDGRNAAALSAQADALDKAVGAFRSADCTTEPDPGGQCTQALDDIAGILATVTKLVNSEATTG